MDVFSGVSLVCLSVSLFVNTITSELVNVGWWNLAIRYTVQKSPQSSNVKVNGQKSRSPGTKKTKKCGILFGSRPLGRGPRAAFFSAAVLGGAVHYAGGKISACCIVFLFFFPYCIVNILMLPAVIKEKFFIRFTELLCFCSIRLYMRAIRYHTLKRHAINAEERKHPTLCHGNVLAIDVYTVSQKHHTFGLLKVKT